MKILKMQSIGIPPTCGYLLISGFIISNTQRLHLLIKISNICKNESSNKLLIVPCAFVYNQSDCRNKFRKSTRLAYSVRRLPGVISPLPPVTDTYSFQLVWPLVCIGFPSIKLVYLYELIVTFLLTRSLISHLFLSINPSTFMNL